MRYEDDQRYLWLRQLNPRQFAELHQRNLAGKNFDSMVDYFIETKTYPEGKS